jgi:hypothetical protein
MHSIFYVSQRVLMYVDLGLVCPAVLCVTGVMRAASLYYHIEKEVIKINNRGYINYGVKAFCFMR